jgi:hypothetical protein
MKSKFPALLALTAFLISVGCVAPPPKRTSYNRRRQAPAPVQCVTHSALSYSPVLVKVNINLDAGGVRGFS